MNFLPFGATALDIPQYVEIRSFFHKEVSHDKSLPFQRIAQLEK